MPSRRDRKPGPIVQNDAGQVRPVCLAMSSNPKYAEQRPASSPSLPLTAIPRRRSTNRYSIADLFRRRLHPEERLMRGIVRCRLTIPFRASEMGPGILIFLWNLSVLTHFSLFYLLFDVNACSGSFSGRVSRSKRMRDDRKMNRIHKKHLTAHAC